VVLFGLALVVGGAGVLVALRDELGIRLPAFLAAPLDRWSVEALRARLPRRLLQPLSSPPRATAGPRAVGRASVSGQTVVQSATQTAVQERVRRPLHTEREGPSRPPETASTETRRQRPVSLPRAVGRAAPPPSSRSHPEPMP
jgi:hypothetical protein